MMMVNWKKIGIFAGGVLFGSAGLKALSSRDAKSVYTQVVAAGLRAKDCAMDTVSNIQENIEDIVEEAKFINAEREIEEALWEDDCYFEDEFDDDFEVECCEECEDEE